MVGAFIFIALTVGALTSFAFAWEKFSADANTPHLPQWRRKAAAIACLVVAMQGANFLALFVSIFSRISTHMGLEWIRYTLWLFIVGALLVIVAKGPTRWYLLLCSTLLFLLCSFTALAVLNY